MANEAVIIELLGNGGDPVSYTCADGPAITKGQLLWFLDPRTVSGASIAANSRPVAGIAAASKTAADGSTRIAVYTRGIFDCIAGDKINAGDIVGISGLNYICCGTTAAAMSGALLGTALETAAANEVIAVKLDC